MRGGAPSTSIAPAPSAAPPPPAEPGGLTTHMTQRRALVVGRQAQQRQRAGHRAVEGQRDRRAAGRVLVGRAQLHGERRVGAALVAERLAVVQELAVAPAELAEDAQRGGAEGVRRRLELLAQRDHELAHERRHERLHELGVEVVDPELERAQRQRDELGGGAQRVQHGVHQQVQVRQQRREPRRQREAQLEQQLAHGRLVRGGVRADERVEQRGQQRQELLVELLELAAADGLEERAQQREEVERLRHVRGAAHGRDDDGREVRPQHGLVLGEERDRAEDELEEAQQHRALRLVGRAELLDARDEEAEQDVGEVARHVRVGEEVLQDGRHDVVGEHALVQEGHLHLEDVREVAHLEHGEDAGEVVEHLLLLLRARVGAARVEHEAAQAALEQPRHQQALGLGHALLQHGVAGQRVLRLHGRARVRDGPDDGLDAEDHRLEQLLALARRVRRALVARVGRLGRARRGVDGGGRHDRRLGRPAVGGGGGGLLGLVLLLRLLGGLDLREVLGDELLERGELGDEAVQDAHEQRAPLGLALVEDVLDEVEQQPHGGRLDVQRQRRVVDVAREDVDHLGEVRDAQLAAHVVHEVGEGRARERPQRLVRRAHRGVAQVARADEELLVEQDVDLVEEAHAEVGGEDVPRRHEDVLADRDRLGRAGEQQLDDALGDGLLVGPHEVGEGAQQVGEEGERLDLRRHEVGAREARAVHGGLRRAQRERLHHERDEVGDGGRDVARVELEEEHHDERALGQHLERLGALGQHAARRRARPHRRRAARRARRLGRLGARGSLARHRYRRVGR
eukprot:scaffold78337_cov60-Phaeocystis_antarctica.AAC.1